ncbi:hypothetical protein HY029_05805 [Candidatus Gottesmanbacteria bacterium]|nr:hypothetical protein [Candidatus Gottesmanbacteria bacterium]
MDNKKFPQINRKLTAGLLLVFFLLISVANIIQNRLFKVGGEKKLHSAIMQNPNLESLHERLGQYYLGINKESAEREYRLAQENFISSSNLSTLKVLGSQSSPWQTWQNIEAKIQNLESETSYWEKVTLIYPDYLYAELKLALLNMQRGNPQKAKNYLLTVLNKDPSNEDAIRLLREIN